MTTIQRLWRCFNYYNYVTQYACMHIHMYAACESFSVPMGHILYISVLPRNRKSSNSRYRRIVCKTELQLTDVRRKSFTVINRVSYNTSLHFIITIL